MKSYSIIDKIIAQHIIAQPKKIMIVKSKIKNFPFSEKRFMFPKKKQSRRENCEMM